MGEILDPTDQKPGEDRHPPVPNLLQTQGTGYSTIHGRAAIYKGPTI